MKQICIHCSAAFEITNEDLAFYDAISPVFNGVQYQVPPPTLCPSCREQRRMAWRNERNLHHRKSSLSGKQIISLYPEESPVPVFAQDEWWSDGWDQHASALQPRFDQPFFEQLALLQTRAPRLPLLSKASENSDYTNHAANNRNCYLSFICFNSEDILYSRKVFHSRNIVDSLYVFGDSELVYDAFWVEKAYRCISIRNCSSVSDSAFCIDCRNCSHCFLCSNLRGKQYCFLNEQLTPAAYRAAVQQLMDGTSAAFLRLQQEFSERCVASVIYPATMLRQCENCIGDYLQECRNVRDCYYSSKGEDMAYCLEFDPSRANGSSSHCMDCFGFGGSEWIYEVQSQASGYRTMANNFSYDVRDCYYVDNCHDCTSCFGCIGLRNKKYCILNTQYAKEEYEELVPKMIEHMQKTGEWGEFFPISLSPFAYNETVAQEYYPLASEEAHERGFGWRKEEVTDSYLGPEFSIPDAVSDVSDDITKQILQCEVTGRHYKIIPQELKFYRQMGLPIPRKCPDQRHKERMALRNPRKLWTRTCAKCSKAIQTTYAPERPEIVYCERCYLDTVY